MYNETYDEYIRSILRYPTNDSYNSNQTYSNQNLMNSEVEKCYPEIYKIVYPMVKTKCDNFRGTVNNEDIENMTDEIYSSLESNDTIQLNINLTNNIKTTNTSSNTVRTTEKKPEVTVTEKAVENRETRQLNRSLRDLIKILLIRELLNRPGRPPMRPPMYRPPMPGPGPRPPMRPPYGPRPGNPGFNREFDSNNYDIFEY